ncbi:MAG: UDP-N-acetylmuramoyl-L-alanyl-D-glutamate--2,6-diaminopimelate ligase [Clostridiales bacterium]|nr:UDP-N-acetylmuramoyl-L-alanyl-D-glutamate--2,6-diaminopimelate ligase [Candidatus Equinaster intestinalis]
MKLKDLIFTENKILAEKEITGITCNSSKVKEGFLFVCIKGTKADGHSFAADAVSRGTAAVLCEQDLKLANQILVPDTHRAYFTVSANWFSRPADSFKLIGVTGTNGKTTVTNMIKSILEAAGKKTGLIGTIENTIGDKVIPSKNTTPDAYELNSLFALMRDEGAEYVVMEVSSHALDQKRICDVQFEVAAFTNLTRDHLDYHITMENYFEAKKKLFEMCKCAVINFDDDYGKQLLDEIECEKISYSLTSDATTYTAKEPEYRPDGVKYQMVGYNFINRIKVGTGGKFTVYNSLCAAACAVKLGIDADIITKTLGEMQGVKGRAEVVPTGRNFTIVIDYAHTPDGLQNILNTFREYRECRLVVVFGCGGDRDKTKRPIMGEIAVSLADFVIVTSDNPRSEEPMEIINDILVGIKGFKTSYKVIENRKKAIRYAIENARENDIIVLAGKGHETYQILKDETIHFDEREVIKEILAEN